MHDIWVHLFVPSLPILEKIIRPIIVYFFLVLVFRLSGKRELVQLNPFDLVVLLTISNTVQNAIIGDDNSVAGGMIGATSLVITNYPGRPLPLRSPETRPTGGGQPGCVGSRRRNPQEQFEARIDYHGSTGSGGTQAGLRIPVGSGPVYPGTRWHVVVYRQKAGPRRKAASGTAE